MSKTIILTVKKAVFIEQHGITLRLAVPSMKAATDLMRILGRCLAYAEDHFPNGLEGGYQSDPVCHLFTIGDMSVKTIHIKPQPPAPKQPKPVQPKVPAAKRLPAPPTIHLLGNGDDAGQLLLGNGD